MKFPVLATISKHLAVTTNTKLTAIGEFPSLTVIGGDVEISKNGPSLVELGDFGKLTIVGGKLNVEDNPGLPKCDVDTLRGGLINYAGTFTNTGNGPC